jgi:hypothetical protein
MKVINKNGNVMVKLLISMIAISVVSTAVLNIQRNSELQITGADMSHLMSLKARTVFDKISYHLKLAGYGNTGNQKSIEIRHGETTDSLIIYHNDIEFAFYVAKDELVGGLVESVDGSPNLVIENIEALRVTPLEKGRAIIEIKLGGYGEEYQNEVVSRSYSTTVKYRNII